MYRFPAAKLEHEACGCHGCRLPCPRLQERRHELQLPPAAGGCNWLGRHIELPPAAQKEYPQYEYTQPVLEVLLGAPEPAVMLTVVGAANPMVYTRLTVLSGEGPWRT